MKMYRIAIEETLVQEFEIRAENEEAARKLAEAQYKRGEIVLESGEVQYKQLAIVSPLEPGEEPRWLEF